MSKEQYYVCMSCKKGFEKKQDKEKKDNTAGICPNCGREMRIVQYSIWR